jgi:hypothetical protein
LSWIGHLLRERRRLVPFVRLAARYFESGEDVWVHMPVDLPPYWFGSRHDFWHYLSGSSTIRVRCVDEMCAWLLECEYVPDPELFHECDYWQHPLTFERLRKGDCEDFALWAWRKLGELGIPARFYVGRAFGQPDARHAWVGFEDEQGPWLLEGTARSRARMLRPLPDVRGDYEPHLSIGHLRDGRVHGGWARDRSLARQRRRNGAGDATSRTRPSHQRGTRSS